MMTEWLRIARYLAAHSPGVQQAVLATVVRATGSTYRRPGAKLLIPREDPPLGSVSGGCLESDVLRRAADILVTGKPQLVHYDTTQDQDILLGVGLGCQGSVEVFIEKLTAPELAGKAAWLVYAMAASKPVAVVTVFSLAGRLSTHPGACLLVEEGRCPQGDIQNKELQAYAVAAGKEALSSGHWLVREVCLEQGRASLFADLLKPVPDFFLFGAGSDAVPMLALAKVLGWHVTVVDHRPAFLHSGLFASADVRILCHPQELGRHLRLQPHALAAVLTHNFNHDLELLRYLLFQRPAYLGLLGPKRRTLHLLEELTATGFPLDEEDKDRLYAPMGLDIGGETPEEIALAALAEMQAVLACRAGGFLRERQGAIHG